MRQVFDARLRFTGSNDTLFLLLGRHFGWQTRRAERAAAFEQQPAARITASRLIVRRFRTGNGLAACDRLAGRGLVMLLARVAKAGFLRIPRMARPAALSVPCRRQGKRSDIKIRARGFRPGRSRIVPGKGTAKIGRSP